MAELKKTMGFWMISAISFLSLINTGLFFGVAIGAGIAGESSILAWVALAAFSIYAAMCFAELTTMFPRAGGVYEFAKQAYGRFTSFLFGWIVWVSGNIATALFIVAAVNLITLEPLYIGGVTLGVAMLKILIAIGIIVAMNYIAYRGIEASARLMMLLSVFMLIVIAVIIWPGAFAVDPANLTGFTIQWGAILMAIFFLSETFYGWEAVSFMSEETENPEKVIPRALIATSVFVALIALLLSAITMGVLGTGMGEGATAPVLEMLEQLAVNPDILIIVNIGIIVAFLGNASGNIVSLPRLLLAMSRDKLFIEQFSDIHPEHQTPYKAIIFQTLIAIAIVLIASGAYQTLLEMLVPVSLVMYAGMFVLVPYFRITRPEQPRPYTTPLGKTVPWLFAAFFLGLLVYWAFASPSAVTQLRLLASFLFFSVPIYLILTYFYDPDQLINTMNLFSRLNLWLEDVLIPRRLRTDVIEFFKNGKDKHVLEFGSGVGTLTLHLAEHVGKKGKVYAVGLSDGDIRILRKRLGHLGHTHVEVIHDPHLINRVHPSVKTVDMIVSIGHLSYIQDVAKVLREMNSILPQRGHICFIEYLDLFYFLPNPKWLSDPDEVKRVFADAGFTVTVKVRQGLLWKYMYIYGIKESRNVPYI
jgi:amino acid transporter/ubiquinone/menaquinone biosynthesis C-methylase UbiE